MPFDSRKRENELLLRLDFLMAEAELRNTAPRKQIEQERFVLTQSCKDFVTVRNFYLDLLLRELTDATRDLEAPFKKCFEELSQQLGKSFGERLKNMGNPSAQAELFCMRAEYEEAAFLAGFKRMIEVGAKRDYLVRYDAVVKKQTEDLEILWADVVKQHANYDAVEKQIVDEMARVIAEAAAVAAERTATRGEKIMRVIDMGLQIPIPPGVSFLEWVEMALEGVKGGVTYWRGAKDQIPVRMERFRNSYRSEVGTTLVLFRNFRDQTQIFIDQFNYRRAEKENELGQLALDDFLKACPSEAQKLDVRLFVDEAKKLLQARYTAGKQRWDAFVIKHEFKFFGPVSLVTVEGLLSTSSWREKKLAVKHNDLHSLLGVWRNEIRDHKLIDVANKGAELKRMVGYLIEEMLKLQAALDEVRLALLEVERLNELRELDAKALSG